jgi:hypothetical protein
VKAAPASAESSTPVRAEQQQKNGLGSARNLGLPLLAPTVLPNLPQPGNVPQFPFMAYGEYRRILARDDNMWGRRNFQAEIAQRFAPNAIAATNAVNAVPIRDAQRTAMPALDSRSQMVQQRYPQPQRVFPQQIAVRKEQR